MLITSHYLQLKLGLEGQWEGYHWGVSEGWGGRRGDKPQDTKNGGRIQISRLSSEPTVQMGLGDRGAKGAT